ncbi:MAG: peptidylprolyl isomerase [Alphaproteobacteria bacterium]|nr:peptidylprolyl isomerase [Alphaproteobacteria bacterium]
MTRSVSLTLALLVSLANFAGVATAQSVQTIAAVVNDEIISNYDLQQRVRLVVSSSGADPSGRAADQLTSQILESLIDERLQIQEAVRLNIPITEQEVDGAVRFIEEQNNMPEGNLAKLLDSQGISVTSLQNQLRAQIAWSKVVGQRLRPRVVVGTDEIDTLVERLKSTGRIEHLTSEIFLAFSDQNAAIRRDVTANAETLITQLRGGASFAILAQQFSQAVSASNGGDIGWISGAELPDAAGPALETLDVDKISDPIITRDGIYILQVRDRRRFAAIDPKQVTVTLKQIFIPLKADADDDAIESQMALARTIGGTVRGCEDFDALSAEMGSPESGDLGKVKVSDTPTQFREAILALDVGVVSVPVRTEDGVHVLMVCDREQPEVPEPDRKAIENSIGQARLSMLARRYLRDLRRDAVVDVR